MGHLACNGGVGEQEQLAASKLKQSAVPCPGHWGAPGRDGLHWMIGVSWGVQLCAKSAEDAAAVPRQARHCRKDWWGASTELGESVHPTKFAGELSLWGC